MKIPVGTVFTYHGSNYRILLYGRHDFDFEQPQYLLLSDSGYSFWSELPSEEFNFNPKTNVLSNK